MGITIMENIHRADMYEIVANQNESAFGVRMNIGAGRRESSIHLIFDSGEDAEQFALQMYHACIKENAKKKACKK